MTLRDLHEDPNRLAAFLGVTEFTKIERCSWRYAPKPVPIPVEEWAADWRLTYHRELHYAKYREQTHTQFIADCLRALGLKGKGTVEERRQRYIASQPEIYEAA